MHIYILVNIAFSSITANGAHGKMVFTVFYIVDGEFFFCAVGYGDVIVGLTIFCMSLALYLANMSASIVCIFLEELKSRD